MRHARSPHSQPRQRAPEPHRTAPNPSNAVPQPLLTVTNKFPETIRSSFHQTRIIPDPPGASGGDLQHEVRGLAFLPEQVGPPPTLRHSEHHEHVRGHPRAGISFDVVEKPVPFDRHVRTIPEVHVEGARRVGEGVPLKPGLRERQTVRFGVVNLPRRDVVGAGAGKVEMDVFAHGPASDATPCELTTRPSRPPGAGRGGGGQGPASWKAPAAKSESRQEITDASVARTTRSADGLRAPRCVIELPSRHARPPPVCASRPREPVAPPARHGRSPPG